MKTQPKVKNLVLTAVLSFAAINMFAQGFGLGTSSPSEILHLYNDADVSIRYQGQNSGTGSISTGPNSSGTISDDSSIGTSTWGSTSNAGASDNAYATAANDTSHYLNLQNFGFSVPGSATIDGIQVEIEKSKAVSSIAFRAAATNSSTGSSPLTINKPTGTVQYDVMILAIAARQGATYTITPPAGWTSIRSDGGGTPNPETQELFYKVAGSSEAASYAIAVSGSPDGITGAILTFSGVDNTSPIDANTGGTLTTGSTTNSPTPSINTTADNAMVITAHSFSSSDTDGAAWTPPTGMTEAAEKSSGSGTLGISITTNYVLQASAGATGTKTAIMGATNDNPEGIAQIIALVPATSATDNSVKIIKGGTVSGTEKAVAGEWSTTDAYTTYGGSTDLWGLTWTDTDINASNFGVAISAATFATARIDHVRVTVWYTSTPAAFTNFATGIDNSDAGKFKIAGSSALGTSDYVTITTSGNLGIGTTTPGGKLDVNGAIYQRGGSLHADYVFQPDYKLESIDEHAHYMWTNGHLKAIPPARTDENGYEIVEVGNHRRGIVEELEKAHIYIEGLNKTIKNLKTELTALKQQNGQLAEEAKKYREMEVRIAALEALMHKMMLPEEATGNVDK